MALTDCKKTIENKRQKIKNYAAAIIVLDKHNYV